MGPTCPPDPASMSWGDIAVIQDDSSGSSSAEPMQFVAIGVHTEEGEIVVPPPLEDTSGDESSAEETLRGEALLPPPHDDASCCSKKETEAKNSSKATVSFGTIEIREYSLTIGTNTPTNIMYPLSLDWAFAEKTPQKLDEYEALRRRKRLEGIPSLHTKRSKFRAPRSGGRLGVTDRLCEVTGRSSRALYTEERTRQLRLMEDNRRASLGLGPVLFCT